jgi:hypothetical protein
MLKKSLLARLSLAWLRLDRPALSPVRRSIAT